MTKQKNKITPVEDVFAGLKFVDNMYEAAGKANMPTSLKESFEDKLKQKLTEGVHKVDENRYTDQNNEYPNYNYEAAPVDDAPVEEPVEPAMGADMAGGEMGADMGGDMGMGGADMGGDMGMGDSGMGGAEAGALPTEDIPGEVAPAEQPEDISALVDELIDADIEEAAQETGMMGIEEVVAEMKESDEDDKAPMYEMKDEKMYEMHEGSYHEMSDDDYSDKGEGLYEMKGEMYEMKDGAMYEAKKVGDDDKKDGKNPFAKKDDVKEGVEYKDAGTETPKSNVASASKIDQSKSQGKASSASLGAKYVDLGDEDHKSKVQQGVTRENTDKQDVGSNVASAAKVDQSKSQGDASKANLGDNYSNAGSDADKNWSSVKKESKIKSKALYKLAEKYLSLEDKHKNVQLESYKAVKATGVLALAPGDLTVETREQLAKKFDECANKAQVDKLYHTAVQLMKEHSNKDISQVIGKDSSIKHSLTEGAKNAAPKKVLTEAQKRILFLSGQGHEDQYNNW